MSIVSSGLVKNNSHRKQGGEGNTARCLSRVLPIGIGADVVFCSLLAFLPAAIDRSTECRVPSSSCCACRQLVAEESKITSRWRRKQTWAREETNVCIRLDGFKFGAKHGRMKTRGREDGVGRPRRAGRVKHNTCVIQVLLYWLQ